MATTATLTGTFTLPNDAAPNSAVLSVIMSAMDTDQNTRDILMDDGSFMVALVAGAIPAGQEIWKNTAGLRGTHYRATLAWTASDGRLLSRYLGSFQVGDDASYDMADLLDQPPIATLPEGWYSTLTQGDYDAAITARDQAVAAAAAAAEDRAYIEAEATGTRAAMVTSIAGGFVPRQGRTYMLDGVPYVGALGVTVIPDLHGLTLPEFVTPDHFGGKTGAAITAAWTYFQSVMGTGTAAAVAASGGKTFRFLAGLYNASGSLVTLTTAGFGQTIEGAGPATKLNYVKLVIADGGCVVRGLHLENFGKAVDAIVWEPRGTSIRHSTLMDITIKDARYGLRTIDDASVGWVRAERVRVTESVKGARFDRVVGVSLTECDMSSNDEQGIALYRGGELRLIGGRYRGNGMAGIRLDGSTATGRGRVVVENYLLGVSASGNYSVMANRRNHPITGAADNGAGGTTLTLDVSGGRHWLSNGLIKVTIAGTTLYDGEYPVDNVTDTTVDIDVAYAGAATGTIYDPGFDVEAVGDASIRPSQLNDLFIGDCNINNFYAKDAFNINIQGGRAKTRTFLDGGCYDVQRDTTGRGRYKSTLDDDSDEGTGSGTWKTVPITGQNYGFVEDVTDMGSTWSDTNGKVRRVPDPNVALIGNNVQSYISVGVNPDGVAIEGAVTENGTGLVPSAVAKRLGATTLTPFVLVIEGQSNALGAGTGQDTTIDQSGGGVWIYSRTDGGAGGTMVRAEYGVAPLNRAYGGGTTSDPALSVGNIGPHLANRIRALRAISADQPIWIEVNALGGLDISEWVDSPYTREVAFEAAMAGMSALWGETLTVDHLHWQQGEANGTTAPPYNTDATYFDALTTWYEARKQSQYWGSETTVTVGEILSSRPFVTTDTAAMVRPTNARNPALRRFASAAINPKIAIVPTSDLTPNGTLAQDSNHFSGQGLQTIGERAANRFVGLRAGTISGAHIAPDGRPILTHPQLSFTSETVYLGHADLDTGTTFIRAAAATINLPLVQTNQNVMIYLDVWSASGGNTTVNAPLNTTMEGPLGLVEAVSLGIGTYKFYYLGRWQFTAISPKRGDYLHYARDNLAPQEVYGMTQPQARGAVINSFAGCLIGLPAPEQGAEILIKQRSITTYGAATIGRACAGVSVAGGGSGYAVGDTIVTDLGGASGVAPTLTVNAVSGGVITGVDLTAPACITSSAAPTNPVAQASTIGSGTGATFNLTYSSALIAGPGPTDSAASYSLGTVGQIVDLVAAGGVWNVASDNVATARASSGTWTPVFTNSTPGDLVVSSVTINSAILRYVGPMVYVSAAFTFTPTHTTASGAWQISGLPAFLNATGVSLRVRASTGVTLPTNGDGLVLVLDNAAGGVMKLRTARPDTDLPVANIASGTAINMRIEGWLPLP